MSQQFGDKEPLWIPAALRCYRSFYIDPGVGAGREYIYGQPMHSEPRLRAVAWGERYYDPTVRIYEAECNTYQRLRYAPDRQRPQYLDHEKWRSHEKMPVPNCTCGYYAYYQPKQHMQPPMNGLTPVHGVVSVSGRVLMGTQGVRAEKMSIDALALNMEDIAAFIPREPEEPRGRLTAAQASNLAKFIASPPSVGSSRFGWSGVSRTTFVESYATEAMRRDKLTTKAKNLLHEIALIYGIPTYPTVQQMWAMMPPPNIDHLINPDEPKAGTS